MTIKTRGLLFKIVGLGFLFFSGAEFQAYILNSGSVIKALVYMLMGLAFSFIKENQSSNKK